MTTLPASPAATSGEATPRLESHLNLRLAYWLRLGCVVFASLSAIFLTTAYVSHNYLEAYTASWPDWAAPFLISCVVLVHLVYLYVVNEINVLSKPIDRLSPQEDLLLPFLLGAAYLIFAASILFQSKGANTLALFAMASLYFVWGLKDLKEYRHATKNRRKEQLVVWIGIDGVAFLVLLSVAVGTLMGLAEVWAKALKDLVVFLSVLYFMVSRSWGELSLRTARYRTIYQDFLTFVPRSTVQHCTTSVRAAIAQVTKESGVSIRMLDFGCGDGARSLDLIEKLTQLGLSKPTTLMGVDLNDEWRTPFDTTMRRGATPALAAASFQHSVQFFDETTSDAYDVVVFSHLFYATYRDTEFSDVLDRLRPGGLVLVRGYAPNSIFWTASRERAQNVASPSWDGFWVSSYLLPWARKNELENVAGEVAAVGVTLEAQYPARNQLSADALGEVIEYFYGFAARMKMDQLIRDATYYGQEGVAIDDLLFVYRKP